MMTNAKIGVALVGGYFLGRTKKAKMALGLGLFLAGKKLNLDPKQLGTLVANSPVLGPLNDQVRKELVDATKAAAGTALSQRMSGLADSLHERTVALDEGRDVSGEIELTTDDDRSAADDEEQASEDDARGDAEDSGDAEGAADTEEKRAPRRKAPAAASTKTATKPATKSATKSSAASAKKSGSGARSTARRPSSSASGTAKSSGKNAGGASRERPAASSARKTASGARKKASGTARTAADRGGRNG